MIAYIILITCTLFGKIYTAESNVPMQTDEVETCYLDTESSEALDLFLMTFNVVHLHKEDESVTSHEVIANTQLETKATSKKEKKRTQKNTLALTKSITKRTSGFFSKKNLQFSPKGPID